MTERYSAKTKIKWEKTFNLVIKQVDVAFNKVLISPYSFQQVTMLSSKGYEHKTKYNHLNLTCYYMLNYEFYKQNQKQNIEHKSCYVKI